MSSSPAASSLAESPSMSSSPARLSAEASPSMSSSPGALSAAASPSMSASVEPLSARLSPSMSSSFAALSARLSPSMSSSPAALSAEPSPSMSSYPLRCRPSHHRRCRVRLPRCRRGCRRPCRARSPRCRPCRQRRCRSHPQRRRRDRRRRCRAGRGVVGLAVTIHVEFARVIVEQVPTYWPLAAPGRCHRRCSGRRRSKPRRCRRPCRWRRAYRHHRCHRSARRATRRRRPCDDDETAEPSRTPTPPLRQLRRPCAEHAGPAVDYLNESCTKPFARPLPVPGLKHALRGTNICQGLHRSPRPPRPPLHSPEWCRRLCSLNRVPVNPLTTWARRARLAADRLVAPWPEPDIIPATRGSTAPETVAVWRADPGLGRVESSNSCGCTV